MKLILSRADANKLFELFWGEKGRANGFQGFDEWFMETHGRVMLCEWYEDDRGSTISEWFISFKTDEEAVEFKLKWL